MLQHSFSMYDMDELLLQHGSFTMSDLNRMPFIDYSVHYEKIEAQVKKEIKAIEDQANG